MVMAPKGEAELCSAGTDECVRPYMSTGRSTLYVKKGSKKEILNV